MWSVRCNERSDARELAEVLMDLEAEPVLRLSVMELLKETVPPSLRR
jgi:hypothetical protein